MAQQRSTFGKLQRDRDKKDKAAAKAERREQRATSVDDEPAAAAAPVRDEADVLAALAALHAALEDGQVSIDDFEARRDQLRSQLQID